MEALADFNALDENASGSLSKDEFLVAVVKRYGSEDVEDIPEEVLDEVWRATDANGSNSVTFDEYLSWLRTISFSDTMNAADVLDQYIRELSKEHQVPIPDVEKIVRAWARFEEVYTGEVCRQTFQTLLRSLLAPRSKDRFDVPQGRLDRMWLEADKDRVGHLSFPQFLSWYIPAFIPVSGAAHGHDRSPRGDAAAPTQYYRKLASERLTCFCLHLQRREEQMDEEADASAAASTSDWSRGKRT